MPVGAWDGTNDKDGIGVGFSEAVTEGRPDGAVDGDGVGQRPQTPPKVLRTS